MYCYLDFRNALIECTPYLGVLRTLPRLAPSHVNAPRDEKRVRVLWAPGGGGGGGGTRSTSTAVLGF